MHCRRLVLAVAWLVAAAAAVAAAATLAEEDCLDGEAADKGAALPVEEQPCRMELQVTQHVIGRCMKLGRSFRGCASGPYIQPLHQDCL